VKGRFQSRRQKIGGMAGTGGRLKPPAKKSKALSLAIGAEDGGKVNIKT